MYQELKDALKEGDIGMEDAVYKELLECRPNEDTYDIVTWNNIYHELVSQANNLGVGLGDVPTQVLNQAIFAAVANAGKKIVGCLLRVQKLVENWWSKTLDFCRIK